MEQRSKPEIPKLLEENSVLQGAEKVFLDRTSLVQELRPTTDKPHKSKKGSV